MFKTYTLALFAGAVTALNLQYTNPMHIHEECAECLAHLMLDHPIEASEEPAPTYQRDGSTGWTGMSMVNPAEGSTTNVRYPDVHMIGNAYAPATMDDVCCGTDGCDCGSGECCADGDHCNCTPGVDCDCDDVDENGRCDSCDIAIIEEHLSNIIFNTDVDDEQIIPDNDEADKQCDDEDIGCDSKKSSGKARGASKGKKMRTKGKKGKKGGQSKGAYSKGGKSSREMEIDD